MRSCSLYIVTNVLKKHTTSIFRVVLKKRVDQSELGRGKRKLDPSSERGNNPWTAGLVYVSMNEEALKR
jgi:hypothetical protein